VAHFQDTGLLSSAMDQQGARGKWV